MASYSGDMATAPGSLYVVATPIGNLEDITLRALRVLREVDLIAAEHVPVALTLLRHFEITTQVRPYHDGNEDVAAYVSELRDGRSIALVSDAGTPAISDPGRRLVAAAVDAGVSVIPIPGATAPIALWSASGVDATSVYIYGFLPRKRAARRNALLELIERGLPTILLEAPHRLRDCLQDLAQVGPETQLVIGRELTKLHEQIWRGSAQEALEEFAEPRGEFTILLLPADPDLASWSDDAISQALADAAAQGASRSQAARFVAQQSGRPRRDVYRLWPFESHDRHR